MRTPLRHLEYSVKLLFTDAGFSTATVLTLGVCIGAHAAIFSVVDSLLLSPLPVPESDRIVCLYNSYPGAGVERSATAVPDYYDPVS